ncbi:mandelate racemase/muconate lactonizing enzyme family protein [Alsobacter sp. R-9]
MSSASLRIVSVRGFTVPVSAKSVWIFTELVLEDGPSGWGEATLAGAEEAVLAEIGHADRLLAGHTVAGPGQAVAALRMANASLARVTVMRAIEQAFLDALARRAGMPLASLLGGPERTMVPVYANINRGITDRTPDGFARRAKEVVAEEGYRAIKIAPFDGLDRSRTPDAVAGERLATGLARIAAVRDAIGPDVRLLVDCHSRLTPVTARTVLREVERAGLFWLEEPLHERVYDAETARALRGFANDRGIRIAGGEELASLPEARDFLARGACDAILPDLRWIGIRSGMALLELADASGVGVSLHNPVGPVLDRISVQVAAALPAFMILERQVRESPLFDEVRGAPQVLEDGAIRIDGAPGFGAPPVQAVLDRLAALGFTRPASLSGVSGAGRDG